LGPGNHGLGYHTVDVSDIPDETSAYELSPTRDTPLYKKARIPVQYDFLPYDLFGDDKIQLVNFADGGVSLRLNPYGGTPPTPYTFAPTQGYSEFFPNSVMGRFISFQRKPSAEYLSIPAGISSKDLGAGFLKWADNRPVNGFSTGGTTLEGRIKTPFPGNVGLIVGCVDFKFTWHQVPFDALPNKTINGCIGRVNLRPIRLPGGQTTVALPGQLLLLAADTVLSMSNFGNRLWDVEYTMRYNPRGHNYFYDFVTGGWFQCSKDGVFYGYNNTTGIDPETGAPTSATNYLFPFNSTVTPMGDPNDGAMLYDSRDFQRLFSPE
jgi:hypothetical protein